MTSPRLGTSYQFFEPPRRERRADFLNRRTDFVAQGVLEGTGKGPDVFSVVHHGEAASLGSEDRSKSKRRVDERPVERAPLIHDAPRILVHQPEKSPGLFERPH